MGSKREDCFKLFSVLSLLSLVQLPMQRLAVVFLCGWMGAAVGNDAGGVIQTAFTTAYRIGKNAISRQ
jgi:hypothetical protein